MFEEYAEDAGLTVVEEEIIRVIKRVIDHLYHEISIRFLRVEDLDAKFGFPLDMKIFLSGTDTKHLREICIHFGLFYDADINGKVLITEVEDCKMLLRTRIKNLPTTQLIC